MIVYVVIEFEDVYTTWIDRVFATEEGARAYILSTVESRVRDNPSVEWRSDSNGGHSCYVKLAKGWYKLPSPKSYYEQAVL